VKSCALIPCVDKKNMPTNKYSNWYLKFIICFC
jgi:hypothetical protein